MNFKVEFNSEGHYSNPFEIESINNFGIADLDNIKEKLDIENIDISLIDNAIPRFSKNLYLEINEDLARKSNLFMNNSFLTIRFKHSGCLNEFVERKIEVLRDNENDAITKINFFYQINEEKLLKSWEEKGFPTEEW